MPQPILIAGGGIGGLMLALMLHERGIPCTVFEAVQQLRPLGVGINALPHSIRELAALGLLPRLDAAAIRTRTLTYANHLGQPIWTEPRGMHAGHDAPQYSIHRGRLQALLWDAAAERLGPAALRTGQRLVGHAQDGTGVTARFQGPDGAVHDAAGAAPATADIVQSNRIGGPERVVDLVASRAPAGFASVHDVATQAELAGIVRGYAQTAGFAVAV